MEFSRERKIKEGVEILKQLGLPRGQQNDRSALTLLALLNLTPEKHWSEAERNPLGITPIMNFCTNYYGIEYAPNSRETFRRFTMHQFMQAGIVKYNADNPNRAVNSPNAIYQIEDHTLSLLREYESSNWRNLLQEYLEDRETLIAQYANERERRKVEVEDQSGILMYLTPGDHSNLIKGVLEDFAPYFVPGGKTIYAGDTGEKTGYFEENYLKELGVTVDVHGKMPDGIIYYPEKNWLVLVEAVTSHGPVDSKRHQELSRLFQSSNAGIVYVTAFPDRSLMARYLSEIAWETEVWCADSPTHLIHFNGIRFLGPYE